MNETNARLYNLIQKKKFYNKIVVNLNKADINLIN